MTQWNGTGRLETFPVSNFYISSDFILHIFPKHKEKTQKNKNEIVKVFQLQLQRVEEISSLKSEKEKIPISLIMFLIVSISCGCWYCRLCFLTDADTSYEIHLTIFLQTMKIRRRWKNAIKWGFPSSMHVVWRVLQDNVANIMTHHNKNIIVTDKPLLFKFKWWSREKKKKNLEPNMALLRVNDLSQLLWMKGNWLRNCKDCFSWFQFSFLC